AQFQHKCIMLTGQIIHSHLRERVRREVGLDPNILTSEEIILGSADTGQIYARTTPFTLWLERYLQHHPDLYAKLGWAEEHRTKALLEFVPPNNVFLEQDEEEGLVLTMWKHRPLIRYRSYDLAWMVPARDLVRSLNRHAKGWRRDFKRYG